MAEEKAKKPDSRTDQYFGKMFAWLSERIAAFVAFLFLLFAAGAGYGAIIITKFADVSAWLLLAPIGIAVIAYYNRGVASVLFAGLVLLFVI